MTIVDFFTKINLNNSLLLGYYGGSNFGDELLLEIIQAGLFKNDRKNIIIRYTDHTQFSLYHKNYNYTLIDGSVISLMKSILKQKNIIVGGGGFWGLDFNLNTFLMGVILFIARFIFFKKIYLIGIGYYNSTSLFGRFGAFIAGTAANKIVARDKETYVNFNKALFFPKQKLSLDKDIAFYIEQLIEKSVYEEVLSIFSDKMKKYENSLLIGVRRFHNKNMEKQSIEFIQQKVKKVEKEVIFFLFENRDLFRSEYDNIFRKIDITQKVKIVNFKYNPVVFYLWLKNYPKNVSLLAFQFHVIMIAYLAGVPFEPIAYDNKVVELFDIIGIDSNKIIRLQPNAKK